MRLLISITSYVYLRFLFHQSINIRSRLVLPVPSPPKMLIFLLFIESCFHWIMAKSLERKIMKKSQRIFIKNAKHFHLITVSFVPFGTASKQHYLLQNGNTIDITLRRMEWKSTRRDPVCFTTQRLSNWSLHNELIQSADLQGAAVPQRVSFIGWSAHG